MVTQNPVRILGFEYTTEERIEYPFGAGCYYSHVWHEIDKVYFTEYILGEDGLYHVFDYPNQTYTLDEIIDEMYSCYKDSVDNEANQMNAREEIEFLCSDTKFTGSAEDTAWIHYWVNVIRNIEEEKNEYTRQNSKNSENTNV